MIRRLREIACRAVEWAREEYRFHERQLAEASIELEKRRNGWEYWGNLIALGVGVLLPTFILLSPACDPGAAPPAGESRAEARVRIAVAESLAGFLEAYENGQAILATAFLSETCRPEDVEEIASGARLLARLNEMLGEQQYRIEVDETRLAITRAGPGLLRATFELAEAIRTYVAGQPVPPQTVFGDVGTTAVEFREEDGVWLIASCSDIAWEIRKGRQLLEDLLNDR